MSLSILCVTNNQRPNVEDYVAHMRRLAHSLQAEFVLGLDRDDKHKPFIRCYGMKVIDLTANTLQEDVLDQAISACAGDWVLRLDDDEMVSMALEAWLLTGTYQTGNLYAFPRVYLYPDKDHFIANPGIWPDLQTRLGRKELMLGCNTVHAGNPNGTGRIVPYALEHHNLLVKSLDDRRKIAARYEAIRPGAGSLPEYAQYNLPEDFYPEFIVKEYSNGNFSSN
jgi:hypothetical protein